MEEILHWIFIIFMGYITYRILKNDQCPHCKKYDALKLKKSEKIGEDTIARQVTHRDQTLDKDYRIQGYQDRTETVYEKVEYYRDTYQCKFCDHIVVAEG